MEQKDHRHGRIIMAMGAGDKLSMDPYQHTNTRTARAFPEHTEFGHTIKQKQIMAYVLLSSV